MLSARVHKNIIGAARSVPLYQATCWTVNKQSSIKMSISKMMFLRLMTGNRRKERITNKGQLR